MTPKWMRLDRSWAIVALALLIVVLAVYLASGSAGRVPDSLSGPVAHADGRARVGLVAVTVGALVGFSLVVRLVRWALSRAGTPGAVARLLLVEALRERGAMLVVGLLVVFLGLLPLFLDPAIPLRYRLRNYLSYGQLVIGLFLGGYVICLACGSVAADLDRGRAIDVFSKPLRFAAYVSGKCLGLASLVAAGLAACAVVVYTASTTVLSHDAALDAADARAVREEVLTARRVVEPVSPVAFETIAAEQLARLEETNPEWIDAHGGRDAVLHRLREQVRIAWRSMGPGGMRAYLFEGLSQARDRLETLQLRLRVDTAQETLEGSLPLGLVVGGRSIPFEASVGISQVIDLPTSLVDDAGRLELVVKNEDPARPGETPARGSISLPPRGGLSVLYRYGAFGPNLARVFLVRLAQLTFLGALSVLAASFLSFPVATLLSLVIWLLSATSSLLLENLAYVPAHSHGGTVARGLLESLIAPVMGAIARLLSEFSRIDLATHLTEGVVVPWASLLRHAVCVGCGWAGFCAFLAWALLRRREIARSET